MVDMNLIEEINARLENMDIEVKIGNILFIIMLDTSFFFPDDDYTASNHNHSGFEVHFILNGKGVLNVEGKDYILTKNSFCLIRPGAYHYQNEDPEEPILKYCIKFDYKILKNNENYFPASEIEGLTRVLSNTGSYFSDDEYDNIKLIEAVHSELEAKPLGYYSKIQSFFIQIIINILRSVSAKNTDNYGVNKKPAEKKRNTIIEAFISNNFHSKVSADKLAALLNVSNRQLNRIMKKYYHISFKQKLLEQRIEVSKVLLCNTKLPVYSISEKVGYNSVNNFCSIFKQKTGLTPERYRKLSFITTKPGMQGNEENVKRLYKNDNI